MSANVWRSSREPNVIYAGIRDTVLRLESEDEAKDLLGALLLFLVPSAGRCKFETYLDLDGKFRWRYLAGNGEPICWPEAYESEAARDHSIELVRGAFAAAVVAEGA